MPVRRRQRQQQLFKSQASAPAIPHYASNNLQCFVIQRHLISRYTLHRVHADGNAAWAAAIDWFLQGGVCLDLARLT